VIFVALSVSSQRACVFAPGFVVTGVLTDLGVCVATAAGLKAFFPERFA